MDNNNLFAALRAAFPSDLERTAIETADGAGAPLYYRWLDLERGTAMLANLLASLQLPAGARIAVQTEKSVEALMLYLAVLRAGYVYLPLNTAYQAGEIEYFIGNAEPGVVVCTARNFGWVSKIAFRCGTRNVFTLDDDRTGSLLERAAHHSDRHDVAPRRGDDLAAILYTSGTTGRSSRFGIPIARLGFPLAPSEAQIVAQVIGPTLLRELLIEARLLGADEALARGLVSRVVDDGAVAAEALAACERIAALSPQAQRLNKRTLRQLAAGGPSAAQRHEHFGYADSPEHREGLAAFVQKRPARF